MKPEMNQSALAQKIVAAKFSQTNIFFCDLEDIKISSLSVGKEKNG